MLINSNLSTLRAKAVSSISTNNPLLKQKNNIGESLTYKSTTPNQDVKLDERTKALMNQLKTVTRVQEEFESQMNDLYNKEVLVLGVKDSFEKVKNLSDKYNSTLDSKERDKIKKEASALLDEVDKLMGSKYGKTLLSEKTISFVDSDNNNIKRRFSEFKIEIDFKSSKENALNNKIEDNDLFKNNLDIETLLKNPSVIEDSMIKPTIDALNEIYDDKSYLFNEAMEEFSIATNAINDLYKKGKLSGFMKDTLLKFQESFLKNINNFRFQSENLDPSRVFALIR